jgi:hypothetical protein
VRYVERVSQAGNFTVRPRALPGEADFPNTRTMPMSRCSRQRSRRRGSGLLGEQVSLRGAFLPLRGAAAPEYGRKAGKNGSAAPCTTGVGALISGSRSRQRGMQSSFEKYRRRQAVHTPSLIHRGQPVRAIGI